jgi:hypothetical protein
MRKTCASYKCDDKENPGNLSLAVTQFNDENIVGAVSPRSDSFASFAVLACSQNGCAVF